METNQIHRVERPVVNSYSHGSSKSSSATTTLAWLIAALLILVGAAFELGMLGYGPYNSNDIWLYSVAGKNVWIMLNNLDIPHLKELLRIWPMLLIGLGSGILLTVEQWSSARLLSAIGNRRRDTHGN